MLFKKKIKKTKYEMKLSHDQVIVFVNLLIDSINYIKTEIEMTEDFSKLENLINKRNALMNISNELGFKVYQLDNQKDVKAEIEQIKNNRNCSNLNEVQKEKEEDKEEEFVYKNGPVEIF